MGKKSLFDLEDLRTNLALENKLYEFKKNYRVKAPVNKNKGRLWDVRFYSPERYEEQDAMTREKINFIVSLLPKNKSRILDLGIGQGYLEQRLKLLGVTHELYGVDISRKSIERANKNFRGKFVVENVLNIDKLYKKEFFDVIVAIELIEHISPPRIFSLYKHVRTILKKKGIFIISTPLNEGLRHMKLNPSAHVREYTIPILKTEFKLSGLKINKIKTFYAFKNLYPFKKFISKFIKKWEPNNVVIIVRKSNFR